MSVYFEIADLSFELIDITMEMVESNITHFFTSKPSEGFTCIKVHTKFVEDYTPLHGDVLLQDPYRLVLKNDNLESRIFMHNPFSDIYGIYHELPNHEILIETQSTLIGMFYIELLTIEKYLLENNAFILHACLVEHNNTMMAFTAPSGTGKSTQGNLWEAYGNGRVINGDRSIMQYKSGEWIAHSLPFCGSSFTNHNVSAPLKSVVIVNRDRYDHCDVTNRENDYPRIMNEITVNKWDRRAIDKIMYLADRLFEADKIMNLYCTPNKEAVNALKEYLYDAVE